MMKPVILAVGHNYRNKALKSIRSLIKHNPKMGVESTLISDTHKDISPFHHLISVPGKSNGSFFMEKTLHYRDFLHSTDAEKLVFLDADTHIDASLDGVIWLLNNTSVDIAGCIAPCRNAAGSIYNLPDSYPEINTGVLFVRRTNKTISLFDLWYDLYKEHTSTYHNDQGPFRDALYKSPHIKFHTLSNEYNFRYGFGGQVSGRVKIIHGRSENLPKIADAVNANTMIRSWRRGDLK
jgi:lipopolysaccharide biosynthesis glycosyltransferase